MESDIYKYRRERSPSAPPMIRLPGECAICDNARRGERRGETERQLPVSRFSLSA
jgi:hypothetical protein